MTEGTQRRLPIRRRYLVAAAGALIVTIVFLTLGDGVNVPEATGFRRIIIDTGHPLVWGLLTCSFIVAAIYERWTRGAQILAAAAGVTYAVFLCAVFIWPQ